LAIGGVAEKEGEIPSFISFALEKQLWVLKAIDVFAIFTGASYALSVYCLVDMFFSLQQSRI